MKPYSLGTARVSKDPPSPPVLSSNLLAYYPLSPPSALVLPETEQLWRRRFGEILPVPSAIYTCVEEAAPLVDQLHPGLDSRKLAPPLLERALPAPLYRRRAVGLKANSFDWTMTIHPRRGVELFDPAQQLVADNAGLFDVGAKDSLSMLLVFRVAPGMEKAETRSIASKIGIMEKLDGGEAAAEPVPASPGYAFGVDQSGSARFGVLTAEGSQYSVSSPGRVDDGAWHCAIATLARVAPPEGGKSTELASEDGDGEVGTLVLLTDQGNEWTPVYSKNKLEFSNEFPFCLGANPSDLWKGAHVQIAYLAMWVQRLDESDLQQGSMSLADVLNTFWTAHEPRRNLIQETGGALELVRPGGVLGWPVGTDPFGEGNCVAKYSGGTGAPSGDKLGNSSASSIVESWAPQYPFTLMGDSDALSTGGYGSSSGYGRIANLLFHSEDFGSKSWMKSKGVSVDSNRADAPDGMLTADRATFATEATAWVSQPVRERGYTEAEAEFVVSLWVRLISGHEDATLYLGGVTDDTSQMTAFALGGAEPDVPEDKWIRLHAPVAPPSLEASTVGLGLRITVEVPPDVGPVELLLWGAQLATDGYPGPYLPTTDGRLHQEHGAALFVDLSGGDAPYEIGPKGHVSFTVRLPYEVGEANDRTLLLIPRKSEGGEVVIVANEIRVTRRSVGTNGDGGHIALDIETDDGTVSVESDHAYGVASGEGADQAIEVPVTIKWEFGETPGTAWLQVADEGAKSVAIADPPSGFQGTALFIGPGEKGKGGVVSNEAPDAQIYEVKVYKP